MFLLCLFDLGSRARRSFTLSKTLSEAALQILLKYRLGEKRSPEARKKLLESREKAAEGFDTHIREQEEKEKERLDKEKPTLLASVRYHIGSNALAKFSYGCSSE